MASQDLYINAAPISLTVSGAQGAAVSLASYAQVEELYDYPATFPPDAHSHDLLDSATDAADPSTLVERSASGSTKLRSLVIQDGPSAHRMRTETWLATTFTDSQSSQTMLVQYPDLGNLPEGTAYLWIWPGANGYVALTESDTGIPDKLASATISGANTVSAGTTWAYGAGAAAVHATALGLGTTDTVTFSSVTASSLISSGSVRAGAGSYFYCNGRSILASPTDGKWQMTNNAGTDFTMLQFGGATASFPALKRSTTSLAARLADDSADAPLTCSDLTASGTVEAAGLTVNGERYSPYMGFYVSTPAATDMNPAAEAAGTYFKAAGTTTITNRSTDTMDDASGTSNRIRYTGTTTRHMHIVAQATVGISGGTNQTIGIQVYHYDASAVSGSLVAHSEAKTTIANTNVEQITTHADVMLDENDYLEIWVANHTSNTIDPTLQLGYMFAVGLPG